jgi:predicted ATPase with chaperone activity
LLRPAADSTRECRCTPAIIQLYLGKISGPLLDRIDLHVEAPGVPYKEMRARQIQHQRGHYIAQLPTKLLCRPCRLDRNYWS